MRLNDFLALFVSALSFPLPPLFLLLPTLRRALVRSVVGARERDFMRPAPFLFFTSRAFTMKLVFVLELEATRFERHVHIDVYELSVGLMVG